MTTVVQTNLPAGTDRAAETLQLQLAHVVIDCDAQVKASVRYHSVRAAVPSSKTAPRPSLWPTLTVCSLLLTLATALSRML